VGQLVKVCGYESPTAAGSVGSRVVADLLVSCQSCFHRRGVGGVSFGARRSRVKFTSNDRS